MRRTIDELHKRRYLDKNMFDGHTMNLRTGVECKDADAGESTLKSPEADSPPPPQCVLRPPSSALSLRRKVSTSQGSEFNIDCEDQCAVAEASTPEISKTFPVDLLGPGQRSNKTLVLKDATSRNNNTSLEQRHEGGKRLDPLRNSKEASDSKLDKRSVFSRKSKELLLLHANKQHSYLRKSGETLGKGRNKRPDSLPKYKELSASTSKTGPKTSLEATDIEAHQVLQAPQATSTKTCAAQKNSGPGFLQATTSYNERKTTFKKTHSVVPNDGRVAAHSSELSVHKRCKYPWCAANDPDYLSPPAAEPRKYLVSKKYLLKPQIASKSKNNKSLSVLLEQKGKLDGLSSSQSGEASSLAMDVLEDGQSNSDDGGQNIPKSDSVSESSENINNDQTFIEININHYCLESGGEQVDGQTCGRPNRLGSGSESPESKSHDQTPFKINDHGLESDGEQVDGKISGRPNRVDIGSESPESKNNDQTPFEINDQCLGSGGEQVDGKTSGVPNRVRRSYIHLTQEQEAELVKLRRQLIQERKQAGEWMIDSAIEEAIQKLAPSGETTVKVLVEAFESIISHNDDEIHELHWDRSHKQEISHTRIAMHC